MDRASIAVRRYGAGKTTFIAACSARYAKAAAGALRRSMRLKPFVDEAFLAAEFERVGIPRDIMTELLEELTIDDEAYLVDDPAYR